MSNDTIFKIFFCITVGIIGLITAIGSIKLGKESLKELKEHEELKRRNKIPSSLRPQRYTIEKGITLRLTEKQGS